MRSRNFSGDARSALDYASDTEAVQSPPRSIRSGRLRSSGAGSRSNSLPRTFNREALLRHPELSMELDRLSAPEDNLSDTGESRLGIRHSARGEPDNSHLPLASDGSQKSSLPDITLTYSWHVVMGV